MKKVLIVASVASMIDQFNMENINILKKLGYEVHVAANFENGSTSSKERMIRFKKELEKINVSYFQIDFSRKITNIIQNMKAYKQIKKIIKNNNYEFIHCHSPIGGVCGRIVAKATKTKVIYTAHGFHFFKGASRKNWFLFYPIEKCLSYLTDILITINKEDYNLAIKYMNAKKVYYIPGVGINTDKFRLDDRIKKLKRKELGLKENELMIFSVGELNRNKNHEVIIKAISEIKNEKIKYYIAGIGEKKYSLEKLIKDLELDKQVKLLGFRNDIGELYKSSDIFCFPSYREGLSVALMEAMASSLPVVCSNIRGNVDLIEDAKGGYLCNPNSINEFGKSIKKLCLEIEKRNSMGKYNREIIKGFSSKTVNNHMKKIYMSINNEGR